MKPSTHCPPVPAWGEPAPRRKPFSMRVSVSFECGAKREYTGLFSHPFDAYDDALERFPNAGRIEVQATGSSE